MNIEPVAIFRSPLPRKFGIPRQAGLAPSLRGSVVLEPSYRSPDALRGLEGFDYLWLIWQFSLNPDCGSRLTVRPPRLGGNERTGVFASRSPFRPNGLGLSSVRIESVDPERGVIEVSGADLADGTPIFDIKPYVEYADSHPGVRSGFVDAALWDTLEVRVPHSLKDALPSSEMAALEEILSQDPRPQYQDDPERIYGMTFAGREVHFKISCNILEITDIIDSKEQKK